jgi:hypothetical protein
MPVQGSRGNRFAEAHYRAELCRLCAFCGGAGYRSATLTDTTRLRRYNMSIRRAPIGHICTCNGE